ncbi:MAG: vancomycin resistance protein, partial [Acetatifactor sp.]|nr:vancomycin resistance protein [Acetatifactor sp.]
MRKKIYRSLVCGIAVFMLAANTLSVSAADMSAYFDAEFYAEQYPDIVEICGTDEEALYEHYVTYGIKEGRNCSEIFNVQLYRQRYPDLDETFGDDWEAYVEHYLTSGVQEGRDGCGEFDAVT